MPGKINNILPIVSHIYDKGKNKLVDISSSFNLYLTYRQSILYEKAIRSKDYNKNVQFPLDRANKLIPFLWKGISSNKNKQITLIDLGPAGFMEASRHINLFKADFLISKYTIIDVNRRLLSRAASRLSNVYRGEISEICEQFENVPRDSIRIKPGSTAIFLLGSTAMNFTNAELAKAIAKMVFPGDFLAISMILRIAKTPTFKVAHNYESNNVRNFTFAPLELLGGERQNFEYKAQWNRDRIEFTYRAINNLCLAHPKLSGIRRGDIFVTGFSRRPTISSYISELDLLFDNHRTMITEDHVAISMGRIKRGG